MKYSIQTRLFFLCSLLVLITSISITIPFYSISKRDKQAESQVRIRVAFEIIRDDILNRTRDSFTKTDEFLRQVTAIPWELTWYKSSEKKKEFFSNPTYSSYIDGIGEELLRFNHYISADKIALYTADKRLLISYLHRDNMESILAYVITQEGKNSCLRVDDYTRLLIKREVLPELPLPFYLESEYQGDIPDIPLSEHYCYDGQLGLRTITPIYNRGVKVGVLVSETPYELKSLERYAKLSKTEVDLFADNRWLFGTRTEKQKWLSLPVESVVPIADLIKSKDDVVISSLTLGEQKYYHGKRSLTDLSGNPVGAIAVSLSQAAEKSEIRKMFSIILLITVMAIIISFGLIVLASLGTMRFIQKLTKSTTEIANGNLDQDIDLNRSDEFGVLADSFAKMRIAIKQQIVELTNEIHEHKQTAGELSILRNYLMNIINSMSSILIGVDNYCKVTQWNTQAELTTGINAEKAIGRELLELIPRLDCKIDAVIAVINGNEKQEFLRQQYFSDDKQRYEDITIYPLIASGIQGAVIRIDDITERVQMETMMVQAEKMGSVAGLAAGMAHEINNPLSIINQGLLNIQRRLDPALARNIEVAEKCGLDLQVMSLFLEERKIMKFLLGGREAVARAATIVKNMLMFSRKSDSELRAINIIELIDHTIELGTADYDMKKKYDFKFVEIVKDYDSNVPQISCCPNELEQVLLNLFKNSLQAMEELTDDEYKPKFYLRIKKDQKYVRIEVEDNGPGMPDDVKQRIFEPFFTTKAVGIGTGLGLSVSYMIIVQNHHGTFEVESSVGRGTKFIIGLPLV